MHQQQMHREEARGAFLGRPLRGDHHLRGPALPPHRLVPARRRSRRRRGAHPSQRGGRRACGADVAVHSPAAAVRLAAVAPTELAVLGDRR